ncbi:MAG TPA: ornithine carbamoyltransferase [Armatimonadota bacterium]|nr:ornithine carbamoyltransferase [Armatimonadota bacterium]
MTTIALRDRDLLSIDDFTAEELAAILSTAALLKRQPVLAGQVAAGKTLAMIFEKPSLRTRVTFEVAMTQLGGHAIYLQPADIGLGTREPVKDVARNLSRWCDVIMARTFTHETVRGLAEYASVPVINALSDLEHPCQALADFLTISEYKATVKGRKLAYVGDGNNVAHSLLLLAAKLGMRMAVGCPPGYEPDAAVVARAAAIAAETGGAIDITADPVAAVKKADAVYTDVWTSMGQEEERAERLRVFPPYQLNAALLAQAKPGALVMHCLPAHRGEEITDEVMESPQSVVLDQAENRLHAQKAVIALLLGLTPL